MAKSVFSSGKLRVTVVIPAYNEEKTIEDIIKNAKKYCDDILVVISKKSSDSTLELVKKSGVDYLIDSGVGKGEALRLAINHVNDGIIVFMDSDGSHDPADIPRLIEPIQENKADLVVGSRMTGGSEELYGTFSQFLRLFASCMITLMINYRFGVQNTDYQNGFRAIRVDVAKKLDLKENITTIEQEMGIKCLKKGFRIAEVPSHEYKRKFGKSVISLLRDGPQYFFSFVKNII